MKTILVVDDKLNMRRLLTEYLTEQGFRVSTAADGSEALYTARRCPPDLILLDIMMPKMDGYEFLRQYRKEKKTPVIILTALGAETDAVLGLDLGADDYVIKPFRMHELHSRIRAVLRRADNNYEAGDPVLHIGNLILNENRHQVTLKGELVRLTPMEFELLRTLISAPGRVYTREQLIEDLSGRGFTGLSSTLNVHIRNLRLKIERDSEKPEYIETIFGVGYRIRNPEE